MKKRANVPLASLRAFEAAARLGRMTLAAEELAVTHGAISRQVGQLQARLGVALFDGPRNRPVLTAAGATLLQVLTPAFDQIDAAVRTVGDVDPGVVDVACFSTLAVRWLIPRLHRFQHAHPSLDVRLLTDERAAHVADRKVDVEIALTEANKLRSDRDTPLFDERLGVVLAPALLRTRPQLASKPWRRVPQISARTRSGAWNEWAKLFGLDPLDLKGRKLPPFEHYAFAIEAAASGLGACVTPHHLVADDIAHARLIAPFGFRVSGQVYVARQRHARNRSARHFVKWLELEAHSFQKQDGSA